MGLAGLAAACGGSGGKPKTDAGPTCPAPFDGSATLAVTHPNPLISLNMPAFASPNGNAATLVTNGVYHNGGWNAGKPSPQNPSWVAIKLAPGPTRVLLSWDDGGTYDYDYKTSITPPPQTVYGMPTEHHLDVSADSTDGSDGTASNGLPAGPDFYSYFKANAATDFPCGCAGGRSTDNLHPNDVGLAA